MVLHFNDEPRKQKSKNYFFNKGSFANPESKATLLATWKSVMEDVTILSWNNKMVAANKGIKIKSDELTRQNKKNGGILTLRNSRRLSKQKRSCNIIGDLGKQGKNVVMLK
jgi:hypothetical protein